MLTVLEVGLEPGNCRFSIAADNGFGNARVFFPVRQHTLGATLENQVQ